jgi:hypothetical protein
MEYAARLNKVPSRQTFLAPLVALVVGAGVATGAYALIDNGNSTTASKVIVVERPGPHAADIAGKNEAGTAAAISHQSPVTEIPGKNESTTAAAISRQPGVVVARGSKASSVGTPVGIPSPAAAEASAGQRARDIREDPHGTANSLRNP